MMHPNLIDDQGNRYPLEEGDKWTFGAPALGPSQTIEALTEQDGLLTITQSDGDFSVDPSSAQTPLLINNTVCKEVHTLNEGDHIAFGALRLTFTSNSEEGHNSEEEDLLSAYDELGETSKENAGKEQASQNLEAVEEAAEEEQPEIPSEDEIFTPLGGESSFHIDYAFEEPERWLLKVLSGPNKGAEFALKHNTSYLIGHDPASCDIILYDKSISKKHAEIYLSEDNIVKIKDLGSKNGTYVGSEKISEETEIPTHHAFTIGTSSILVFDSEAEGRTIIAEVPDHIKEKEEAAKAEAIARENIEKAKKEKTRRELKRRNRKTTMVMLTIFIVFFAFVGFGTKALFSGNDVNLSPPDEMGQIKRALQGFPSVEFSYNKTTGKLFLLGHLASAVNANQLLYEVENLPFIQEVVDNIIIDENIWTEQNALLASNPQFEGVSMHAPRPGLFVLNGYVKNQTDNDALINFLNLHFPYLDRLENRVIIEEELNKEIVSFLLQASLGSVTFQLDFGDVTLFGFAPEKDRQTLQQISQKILALKGVRFIKNLVVYISQDNAAVDLSDKYHVTGYSQHGKTNVNVVIDGQIYTRGDQLDGMTIIGIRNQRIFLEKNGVKYKIDYHFTASSNK